MTKFTIDPGHVRARPDAPAAAGLVPPTQRDRTTCDLYAPGHQMHYTHLGDAVRSPALTAREVLQEDTVVVLTLHDGRDLHWRHHDPNHLGRILELLRRTCVIYPESHALRVGPYWFNCAGEADAWQQCRISTASRQG